MISKELLHVNSAISPPITASGNAKRHTLNGEGRHSPQGLVRFITGARTRMLSRLD